ncbi:MAG: hypothetical protein NTV61_06225 [Candidatus Bathyarchaeota archaeon]|nr:hypothetical protein [Candidatus Bathyarchaeota archaeon]
MANWKDEVQKSLESGDHMDKEYEGTYKGSFGYLALTGRKVVFVSEKGLFKKTYTKLLDIPYGSVKGATLKGKQILELTDAENKTYALDINDIPAQIVKDALDKNMKH